VERNVDLLELGEEHLERTGWLGKKGIRFL
jgi:hypothetical protein